MIRARSSKEFVSEFARIASTGMVHEGRILYPCMIVIGIGMVGYMPYGVDLVKFNSDGSGYTILSDDQTDEVFDEIEHDRVEVVLMNKWSQSSRKSPTIATRIHSPKGNDWK